MSVLTPTSQSLPSSNLPNPLPLPICKPHTPSSLTTPNPLLSANTLPPMVCWDTLMTRFLSAHSLTLIVTVQLPVTQAGGGRHAEQTRPLTLGIPYCELFLYSISPCKFRALEAGGGCISLAMHYLRTCVRREVCKAPIFILLFLLRVTLCVLCF